MAKRAVFVVGVIALLLLVGIGCGSDDNSEAQEAAEVQRELKEAKRQAAMRRARAETRREARRRQIRLEVKRERQARQREARRREARGARLAEAEEERAESESSSSCDPNYTGACLDPAASDYDCEGGSGDGPYYTGIVTVTGEDRHGLDSDSDGVGCE